MRLVRRGDLRGGFGIRHLFTVRRGDELRIGRFLVRQLRAW